MKNSTLFLAGLDSQLNRLMKIFICDFINQLIQNSEKDVGTHCIAALLPLSSFFFKLFFNLPVNPWSVCCNCLCMSSLA